jgi:hypothetical protein
MEKLEVEELVEKVHSGRMSKVDGAKRLMEILFIYKRLFGLGSLDEDELSEFLIYQYYKLLGIFSRYDRRYGSFFSFLKGSVRCTYMTWHKQSVRNRTTNDTICISPEICFEESMSHYLLPEESLLSDEVACMEMQAPAQGCGQTALFRNIEGQPSRRYKNPLIEVYRIEDLRKSAALILLLKSSYYMNDDIISKVSNLSGVPVPKLTSMCSNIKRSLTHKIERRDSCIRCRDNAFFFHKKYMLEYSRIDRQTTWSRFILRKYNKQTATWIDKNEHLKRTEYSVSASNRVVANELGISPRKITYIIKQAKQNVDIISIK